MKQTLQLKLTQHLTLTPQLQQSIRLLQLSTLELNAEVDRLVQENPLLEKVDGEDEPVTTEAAPAGTAPANPPAGDVPDEHALEGERPFEADDTVDNVDRADFEDYSSGESDWGGGANPADEDDDSFFPQQAASGTLREHLLGQLAVLNLPLRDRQIVAALIDAVDEDGYLGTSVEELLELFPEELEIEVDEINIALRYLQSFEPCGVGARDAAECLALQLKALPAATPHRGDAITVVEGHLNLLAARDFTRLKPLITSLNPRPGSAFARTESNFVVPDVIVRKQRNQWIASLNEAAMPKLRLNRIYADILTRNRESSNQQLAAQLQEAKWLIRNVQQRFETILRVSQAIVDRQRRFFDHGEVAMRPMVLREIADMLELHESTISRVTTQKYMLTPRGTYELKYFFGSHVATDTGGAASATAIRALIKQLIAAEKPESPLTDSKIAELLGEQGILVARRTIAKYREALQIPPVNLRRAP